MPPITLHEKRGSVDFSKPGGIFTRDVPFCCFGANFNPCHEWEDVPDNYTNNGEVVTFCEEPGPGTFHTIRLSTVHLPIVIIFWPLMWYQDGREMKQDYKGIKFTLSGEKVSCNINVKHLFSEDDEIILPDVLDIRVVEAKRCKTSTQDDYIFTIRWAVIFDKLEILYRTESGELRMFSTAHLKTHRSVRIIKDPNGPSGISSLLTKPTWICEPVPASKYQTLVDVVIILLSKRTECTPSTPIKDRISFLHVDGNAHLGPLPNEVPTIHPTYEDYHATKSTDIAVNLTSEYANTASIEKRIDYLTPSAPPVETTAEQHSGGNNHGVVDGIVFVAEVAVEVVMKR